MRKFTVATALICCVVLLLSCGLSCWGKDRFVIGCSILDTWEPIMKDFEKGWRDAAERYNIEIILVSADCDAEKQVSQVEDFIVSGVDAIILDTADEVGCVPAVIKANRAGIPIFTTDSVIKGSLDGDPNNGEVLCHTFTDNYQGGVNAGHYLAKAIGGKGQVVAMGLQIITCIKDRIDGFKKAIEKYPEIKIIPLGNAGYDRESAKTFMEDVLVSYPDIKGAFGAWGGDTGLGAYLALLEANRHDVKVVNFDGLQEARKLICEGSDILIGDAGYHAYKMMYTSMQIANDYLHGKPIPKTNNVGITFITKDVLEKVGDYYLVKGDAWEPVGWDLVDGWTDYDWVPVPREAE